jgi:hypothetical protein
MQRTGTPALPRLSGRTALILGLALTTQLVLPSPAHATTTTLSVSTTADVSPDTGACGDVTITTAPSPLSLREATCLADNLGGDVTINVPAGLYQLTNGELRLGSQPGQTTTLAGAGQGGTVIDAGGQSRVLELDFNLTGGISTTISGLTLRGGSDDTYGGAGIIAGSGYSNTGDSLTISDTTITGNQTSSTATYLPGGGVQFIGGSLSILNSTISDNSSGNSPGSGLYYQGLGAAAGEELTIAGSTFSGNTALASTPGLTNGGALWLAGANYSITGTQFVNNSITGSGGTARGAAIWSQNGALTITGSTFTGNSTMTGGSGGAIAVDGGTATAHYNRITGNTSGNGQGAYLGAGATLNATENWWGCNTAPGSAGCDSVAGAPTVSPRLVLTATAAPTHVLGPNGTATLTASLLTDSLGAAVTADSLAPAFNGLHISFADPPGDASVTSAPGAHDVTLTGGAANIDYHSHTTLGPDNDSVTLDNATVTDVLEVDQPPTITSATTAHFTPGQASSFTITTTGYPTPAITETGSLPPGLTLHDNGNGSATIAGTPTAGGSYPLTVTANNGYAPNAAQTLTLDLGQPPAFTSAATATFLIGSTGTFTVTTSGSPTVSAITESGTLPAGITFTDNGNGAATITGTPTGTGNSYPLTLTASNGVIPNATQTLTIQVNQAPQVTANPVDQTVQPATTVTFSAAATGVPAPTVQWQRSTDGGATFTTITGATSTTYTFTAALSDDGNQYRAMFTNGIGTPASSSAATIYVGTAPAITSANHTTFVVGQDGSFTITTTGTPAPILSRTGAQFPAWLTLNDNGDGTGALTGTPPAGSGGQYQFTLKAANGFSPSTSQIFTLSVDISPVITSADHTTFTAGQAGSFAVTATAGFPTTTTITKTGSLPAGVTFTDNGDGTATLAGTPAIGTGGSYPITITATASGGLAAPATQPFTLTVQAPPVITSADHTTFSAGNPGSFTVSTSAGNPATTTLTKTGTLPSGVTFTDNGDGTATLAGTPNTGSGGIYTITITASNTVAPNATQPFTLTVNEPPHITSANHVTFTLNTASSFTMTSTGGQPSSIAITETGALPAGVTFTDNGDGTATLAGTPTGTGGSYSLTFTATNGIPPNATQAFTLTVNASPSITSANHTTFTVGTGGSFTVTSTPGNPTTTTITQSGALPSGVTFTDNGDGTATLAGTPTVGTGGSYPLTITASNGVLPNSSQAFTLTVNEPTHITSANHTTFAVGTAGTFTVTTAGGYPTPPVLTETGALPAGVTFADNGDGTATIAGTPTAGGSFPITITANNGVPPDATQSFTLTVNQSPAITSADHTTFATGAAGTFTVTTTPGTPASTALSATGPLPTGVTFHDNGDGTATLAGTPATSQGGSYSLTITASSGISPNTVQSFTLTVTELPTITSTNQATFLQGSAGIFTVTSRVGYPSADTLAEAGVLPSGVSFSDNGDGTATLAGTPAAGTGGSYTLTLTATNTAGHTTQAFTLTVNASPSITSANHVTFTINVTGTFTVTTAGGFPTPPALSETGALPTGVTFHDNSNGTAALSGKPTVGGTFTITIRANNGVAPVTTQTFTLTVNGPPVFTSATTTTFITGNNCGSFPVTTTAAGSPGTTTLTKSGTLPSGVTFTNNGNGTATLAGCVSGIASKTTYPQTFTATNPVGTATQAFSLIVQPPGAVPLPSTLPPSNGQLTMPTKFTAADNVPVSGSGYAPGAPITIGYYPGAKTVKTTNASATGTFSTSLPTFPIGTYTFVAAGADPNGNPRYLEATATVTSCGVAC